MDEARRKRAWERVAERVVASRPGGWFFVNVASRVDPRLLRLSRGRVSMGLGRPVLLLRHRGARSGAPRETPLLYLPDGDRIVLVASNAGAPRHPAWYHNLKAHPEVTVLARGRSGRYRAREAEGPERDDLWRRSVAAYSGYATYRDRARERRIPVMVLERVGAAG